MATITTVKERIDQLSQSDFQILCDDVLCREGYKNITALGTKAGSSKTTRGTPDTYFSVGEKYIFVEYTTQKERLIAKIKTDIEKCLDTGATGIAYNDILEIIYCHTSSNISPKDDAGLKQMCSSVGIKLTIMGIDSLAEKLINYPSLLKEHLHIKIDTEQIQTIDDFISQYNSNSLAATLNTTFMFRQKEFEALESAFKRYNVVLLTGSAGTGKTRLALEYAKEHASKYAEQLLCIHDRSLPLYEDLTLYLEKPGNYFIFIDDANQLSEIKLVVDYVTKDSCGYNVKILITVRDYAMQKVIDEIKGVVSYIDIPIGRFSDDEIASLMEKHYGIQNYSYISRISQIAEGNARIAMLAGKLASESTRLDSINDITALYNDYYGEAIRDTGIDSDETLLITAGIMSFLTAINLDHITPIIPFLSEKDITVELFTKKLHILHQHEIIDICNDKGIRFSEQCLSNFILKYVFYDRKTISLSAILDACFEKYKNRAVNAISTLLSVFHSDDLHDFVISEIQKVWKKLNDNQSPLFFDFMAAFYPVNEIETLIYLNECIDCTEQVKLNASDINIEVGKNNQTVHDRIISILGGFTYSKNIDSALDLLFKYYLKRPDMYIQFYHASIMNYSIQRDSYTFDYQCQIKYLSKIIEYSDDWSNPYITILFLDVAKAFLQLAFSPVEESANGKGMVLCHITLPLTAGSKTYRKMIWEEIGNIAHSKQHIELIKAILKDYGHTSFGKNHNVIQYDAPYILNIVSLILSPDVFADCLIVKSIVEILKIAQCETCEYDTFFNNSLYELYQILEGPVLDFNVPYEIHQEQHKDRVLSHYMLSDDKERTFKTMVDIYNELVICGGNHTYEISQSLYYILSIITDRDSIVSAAFAIIDSDAIDRKISLLILDKLFEFLPAEEVYTLIRHCPPHNLNEWMYVYYHQLPTAMIDADALNGLYSFLRDDSDKTIQKAAFRDINFLEKYKKYDINVLYNASRIILDKKSYSPFMVSLYFGLMLNSGSSDPLEVISKYENQIELLEEIYICLDEAEKNFDYDGRFLHELFCQDKSFIKKYTIWYFNETNHNYTHNSSAKINILYQEDNYIAILDDILDELFSADYYQYFVISDAFRQLLSFPDNQKEFNIKQDLWIKHYIEKYNDDALRMEYLFEALTNSAMHKLRKYLEVFCRANKDYSVFEKIPLTPRTYSYYGSTVPLYSSWIKNLHKLLDLFPGIDFIWHKKRVEDRIASLQEMIRAEEISDIIEG